MQLEPSAVCKVLSVETRLKIIKLLKTKGPLGAQEIARHLGVTTAAISQHLKILSQVGMVTCERKGFYIPYSINEDVLGQCRKILAEACLCNCHEPEPGAPDSPTLQAASLAELQTYEQDLEQKLQKVRRRIKELMSKK
ncbi:MAG: metalloregulator ArsR/SmtB family transcription factor [Bacillota bacterium]|jgi:ArsR family transcriptional regulator